ANGSSEPRRSRWRLYEEQSHRWPTVRRGSCGQPPDGGGAVEPFAALLPHGAYQEPVATRSARLRGASWTTRPEHGSCRLRRLTTARSPGDTSFTYDPAFSCTMRM